MTTKNHPSSRREQLIDLYYKFAEVQLSLKSFNSSDVNNQFIILYDSFKKMAEKDLQISSEYQKVC